MLSGSEVRARLSFDVGRLGAAALRLEALDAGLRVLRRDLEARARSLSERSTDFSTESIGVRRAQAQAVAQLARRTALTDVLRPGAALPFMAAMALGKWVEALRALSESPRGERTIRTHLDAGRVAYRVLRRLRPNAGLKRGVGRVTSAVVVREFVHLEDVAFVDEVLEHGLDQSRFAREIHTPAEAVEASSFALREAARIIDRLAEQGEPRLVELTAEAESVEDRIAIGLAFDGTGA